jgi:hypothetical protein
MGDLMDNFTQYIPPTAMMGVTGTYTQAAGAVTGTICLHRAAAASTGVITIPIMLLSNASIKKGVRLNSIEVDYECLLAAATSITFTLKRVARGVEGAVAVAGAVTVTQSLAASAGAETQDQHKCTVTVTSPTWTDDDEYYLLIMTAVCGGTVTLDVLGAFANYDLRL